MSKFSLVCFPLFTVNIILWMMKIQVFLSVAKANGIYHSILTDAPFYPFAKMAISARYPEKQIRGAEYEKKNYEK
ncbi:MAG TPA: hypothetical protein VF604_19595 [Pyrinomonadaceae bacterium]